MSEGKDVSKQAQNNAESAQSTASRQVTTIRPVVDIFENDSGITLLADMPGVSRDRLDVQIDRDSLSISGDLDLSLAKEMDALYADVQSTRYERSFALSAELDADHAEAKLNDGVLHLHIPKRAEHRARKIEVQTSV